MADNRVRDAETFFDLYMAGKASVDDLDDFLVRWHQSPGDQSVSEYLGLTEEQYFAWCDDPAKLEAELARLRKSRSR